MNKNFSRVMVVGFAAAATSVHAAGIDTTSITTAITEAAGAAAVVGAAYLAAQAGIKAFKMIRQAM